MDRHLLCNMLHRGDRAICARHLVTGSGARWKKIAGPPQLLVITSYIHVTVCVAYNLFVGLDAVLYEALSGAIGS